MKQAEKRSGKDRRGGKDRRSGRDRRQKTTPLDFPDRRSGVERRQSERRKRDRRGGGR